MFYFFGAGLSLREVELVSAITSQLCSREFAEGRSLVLQEYYKIIYTCISLLFRCCVSLSAPPLPPLSLSLCARAKPCVAGCRKQHVLRFVESTSQFSVLSMSQHAGDEWGRQAELDNCHPRCDSSYDKNVFSLCACVSLVYDNYIVLECMR